MAVLREHLQQYRQRSYDELVALLDKPQAAELPGPSGATYQLEVVVHWDHRPAGALRVIGSVDRGGLRALRPLTDDFIRAADGNFVDE
jgi:hypothetical protein